MQYLRDMKPKHQTYGTAEHALLMKRLRKQLQLALDELDKPGTVTPIELADRSERIWKAYQQLLEALVERDDEPCDDGSSASAH